MAAIIVIANTFVVEVEDIVEVWGAIQLEVLTDLKQCFLSHSRDINMMLYIDYLTHTISIKQSSKVYPCH